MLSLRSSSHLLEVSVLLLIEPVLCNFVLDLLGHFEYLRAAVPNLNILASTPGK